MNYERGSKTYKVAGSNPSKTLREQDLANWQDETMLLSYISNTRHVILSAASMRPSEFAAQLNVSLNNGWGIVRSITDICMKLPEGKYVLVKDPNKPVVRLYAVPLSTFTADEDDGEMMFGEEALGDATE
ncbi:Eukaryotic translation initiation factor 3 subunit D [Mycena chlorophos]|uniref:Eukaryotic translation initiation factor 3 subunit D n=1 Tax=Mycena chlorophos TaxID=658473 RepID=A0A8H6S9B1_MYCCL|nr:Eukaryotic translation initiation factor 3 subunit D [Mycena chlorophos]